MDIKAIREDFPILRKKIQGKPLVYLDNAATTHKPKAVLDRIIEFCTQDYSNIHRGAYFLSEESSALYEKARETVKSFIHADSANEIIFTRGTTESINLVADSFGSAFINVGDEIIISEMEHHSNIVPWQRLCQRKGAFLKVIPFNEDGVLLISKLKTLITNKTKLVAITYVSNVLGVVNDVKEIIKTTSAGDIPVLIDGAQVVQHLPVNVRELNCDFFAFSGHKIYADTGIGVLYGKEKWLDAMPPYQSGGGMIDKVSFDRTTYADLPYKFEAGTGSIVSAVSLAAAIEYLEKIGLDSIFLHEQDLINYAEEKISSLSGLTLYGRNIKRCGALSFNLDNIHPYDAGMILDKMGIAVRTGIHCAEPLMQHFGVSGMIRASFAVYNMKEEIDKLTEGLLKAQSMLDSS
ncbi:MAG: aminotransferase class V-fold PLP-dependent enzyme [Acidobacteriota bacterium]